MDNHPFIHADLLALARVTVFTGFAHDVNLQTFVLSLLADHPTLNTHISHVIHEHGYPRHHSTTTQPSISRNTFYVIYKHPISSYIADVTFGFHLSQILFPAPTAIHEIKFHCDYTPARIIKSFFVLSHAHKAGNNDHHASTKSDPEHVAAGTLAAMKKDQIPHSN